jgi:flavodoxin
MFRRHFLKTGLAGIGTLAIPGTIKALTASLQASGKTWAVIYSSQCGSTKDAATWINEGMGSIANVVDIATTPKVADYDYIIIGGWIDSGALVSNAKSYVVSNKTALKDKIRGLFTVCGNSGKAVGQTQINNYLTNQIVSFTGITDKPAKLFNGRSDPKCNGFSVTYDLLKKEDCVAFGKQIIDAATATILDGSEKSQRFNLSHSMNLFTSVATISYTLPRECSVHLSACGLNGRQVAKLISSRQEAGNYSVNWNTANLAPGIYMYRLEAGGFAESRTAKVMGY